MSTWSASASLLVVRDGSVVPLDDRYLRMLERLLALVPEMDAARCGALTLHYNGNSVVGTVQAARGGSRRAQGRGKLKAAG